jgi:hypothetical protein
VGVAVGAGGGVGKGLAGEVLGHAGTGALEPGCGAEGHAWVAERRTPSRAQGARSWGRAAPPLRELSVTLAQSLQPPRSRRLRPSRGTISPAYWVGRLEVLWREPLGVPGVPGGSSGLH